MENKIKKFYVTLLVTMFLYVITMTPLIYFNVINSLIQVGLISLMLGFLSSVVITPFLFKKLTILKN